MQRQERHRGAEPDAGRPLRCSRQHHQWIREDREGTAEMEFSQPRRIKAESVAQFDLCQDIAVTLTFGKNAGARQLVEKAEAHLFPPSEPRSRPTSRIARGVHRRQSMGERRESSARSRLFCGSSRRGRQKLARINRVLTAAELEVKLRLADIAG